MEDKEREPWTYAEDVCLVKALNIYKMLDTENGHVRLVRPLATEHIESIIRHLGGTRSAEEVTDRIYRVDYTGELATYYNNEVKPTLPPKPNMTTTVQEEEPKITWTEDMKQELLSRALENDLISINGKTLNWEYGQPPEKRTAMIHAVQNKFHEKALKEKSIYQKLYSIVHVGDESATQKFVNARTKAPKVDMTQSGKPILRWTEEARRYALDEAYRIGMLKKVGDATVYAEGHATFRKALADAINQKFGTSYTPEQAGGTVYYMVHKKKGVEFGYFANAVVVPAGAHPQKMPDEDETIIVRELVRLGRVVDKRIEQCYQEDYRQIANALGNKYTPEQIQKKKNNFAHGQRPTFLRILRTISPKDTAAVEVKATRDLRSWPQMDEIRFVKELMRLGKISEDGHVSEVSAQDYRQIAAALDNRYALNQLTGKRYRIGQLERNNKRALKKLIAEAKAETQVKETSVEKKPLFKDLEYADKGATYYATLHLRGGRMEDDIDLDRIFAERHEETEKAIDRILEDTKGRIDENRKKIDEIYVDEKKIAEKPVQPETVMEKVGNWLIYAGLRLSRK